jgi:CheY-like chemotaxis protein/HPt (histidine-containing phosphotransfer) domain-containing protein
VKFTEEGEVAINVEPESRTEDSVLLHFAVTDTGIGIPRDKQQYIFESFTQADGSTTRKYGGTGLGLAISSRLVSMMGGRIWVESEPGRGSAFHFTVPSGLVKVREAKPGSVSASATEALPVMPHTLDNEPRSLCILVAEDNLVNQTLAVRLLEKRGHKVAVAADGRQALEMLESQSFDLVIMDLQMPEMDGLEATAKIREREKGTGTHLPIIAMTAYAMKRDRDRCREAGMDGYLAKPIQPQELYAALESIVTGNARDSHISAAPGPSQKVLDKAALLDRVEGDQQLLRSVVGVFLADCPRMMEAVRTAVAERDVTRLEREAHNLKGATGNLGAGDAHHAAAVLESLAVEGELTSAEHAYRALEKELDRLKTALLLLCDEVPA